MKLWGILHDYQTPHHIRFYRDEPGYDDEDNHWYGDELFSITEDVWFELGGTQLVGDKPTEVTLVSGAKKGK